MIQLTDKLIAILVPEDAQYYTMSEGNFISFLREKDKEKYGEFPPLSKGVHTIVGTITKEGVFDFDASAHIESQTYQYTGDKEKEKAVEMNALHGLVFNKKMSAIIILNSKGIFLDKLEGQKVLLIEKI